jgi:DNA gyrase/topoisomerase IV subunit A
VAELEKKLQKVTKEKEQLKQSNAALKKSLADLQKQLNKIIDENSSLRHSLARSPISPSSPPASPSATVQIEEEKEGSGEGEGSRPIPLYAEVDKSKKTSRTSAALSLTPSPNTHLHTLPTQSSQRPTSKSSTSSNEGLTPAPSQLDTPTPTQPDTSTSQLVFDEERRGGGVARNPSMDIIHAHIKSITQCIQELLQAAQAHRQASFGPCSAKTRQAVETMTKLFPANPSPTEVRVSLREMVAASQRLSNECTQVSHSDIVLRTRQIINSAYDVAKAARHLVLCCEQNQH